MPRRAQKTVARRALGVTNGWQSGWRNVSPSGRMWQDSAAPLWPCSGEYRRGVRRRVRRRYRFRSRCTLSSLRWLAWPLSGGCCCGLAALLSRRRDGRERVAVSCHQSRIRKNLGMGMGSCGANAHRGDLRLAGSDCQTYIILVARGCESLVCRPSYTTRPSAGHYLYLRPGESPVQHYQLVPRCWYTGLVPRISSRWSR